MYTKEGAARQIKKEGMQNFIKCITSDNLSEQAKRELTQCNIFVGGFPNLSLLETLA